MIKVSVILPIYNVESFLPRCLDSLINQTLKEIEIICVNDGSTDNSLSILEDYSKLDSRIIIIDEENHNAGYARNQGLKIAKGEYLSFLDSDDFFNENMLELAYKRAKRFDADICIYKSILYDNLTGESRLNTWAVKDQFLPDADVFNYKDIDSNIFSDFMCWAWDKLFKRSFIEENDLRFQEQRTTNDMYFVFSAILKADSLTILKEPLYYQRRNVYTSLSNSRELSWDCFYKALIKLLDEIIHMGIYDDLKQDFINYALHTCIWNLNTLSDPIAYELFKKLKTAWFYNLGIDNQDKDYFENKKDYLMYLLLKNIHLDDLESYKFYRDTCKDNMDLLVKNKGKIAIELSKNEMLTIREIFDELTLVK